VRCAASIGLLATMVGCGTTQMGWNHAQLRSVMLTYTEDQIMDNLIRSYNRFPIIHLDLNSVDSTVDTSLSGTVNGGQSIVNQGAAAISAVTRPLTFALTPTRKNLLVVTMKPQLNANEVYTAYKVFSQAPGRIVAGSSLPSDEADFEDRAHIFRRWQGQFYWIPNKFRNEFYDLSLRVAVARGTVNAASGQGGGRKPGPAATSPKPSSGRRSAPSLDRRLEDALRIPAATPELLRQRDADNFLDELKRDRYLRPD